MEKENDSFIEEYRMKSDRFTELESRVESIEKRLSFIEDRDLRNKDHLSFSYMKNPEEFLADFRG